MIDDQPIMPVDDSMDPLSNYDPHEYADPLEEALAERPITDVRTQPFVVIRPAVPVYRVLQAMAGLEIACVLIGEHDRLIGMFSLVYVDRFHWLPVALIAARELSISALRIHLAERRAGMARPCWP